MPKQRVAIPEDIAAAVLFAADRACCVCNERGLAVQVHHIDEDPANNALGNLAVLCLECHDGTQLKGGFGRKLAAAQVVKYRDDWNRRVNQRRTEAARFAEAASPDSTVPSAPPEPLPEGPPQLPPDTGLREYVRTLPTLRALAHRAAEPGWTGSTADMVDASWSIVEVMVASLVRLARWYPYGHFGTEPRNYFAEVMSGRAKWHHTLHSTAGIGWSGTIVGPLTASSVVGDAEQMVADMVGCLLGLVDTDFDYAAWRQQWDAAGSATEANATDA